MEPIIKPVNIQGGYTRRVSLPRKWTEEVKLKKYVKMTFIENKIILEPIEV
ncbi:MAG: hypothetical protein LBC03_03600 [Nitrososphaerota archaeon]|jgi:hypothetical protein|nr:hypothetical protein [Nitrososphaerota archaeon]